MRTHQIMRALPRTDMSPLTDQHSGIVTPREQFSRGIWLHPEKKGNQNKILEFLFRVSRRKRTQKGKVAHMDTKGEEAEIYSILDIRENPFCANELGSR